MGIIIPEKKLVKLYLDMMGRLNKDYTKRFWNWLSIFQRELDRDITNADNDINEVWGKCNSGECTLMVFLGGLKNYEGLVMRGYGLYDAAQKRLR